MTRLRAIAAAAGLAVSAALLPASSTASAATEPIWVFGTSIEWGVGTNDPTTESWPARLDAMLGGGRIRNLAVGGSSMAYPVDGQQQMDDLVKAEVLAHPSDGPATVIIGGPINDLIRAVDVSPTRWDVYNLVSWLQERGITVFVATITPFTTAHIPSPDALSARRVDYNAWLRQMYGQYGQVIDYGDVLTAGGTFGDPRAFRDSLHPDASAGDGIDGTLALAQVAYDVLETKGLT